MNIKWTAAFLAKTAQQKIHRHTAGTKEQVHLYQNLRHHRLKRHLHHLETVRVLKIPKLKLCLPDICIYILLFPTHNFSILMYMQRIASPIKILFQICWLMKEHLRVSRLTAAWWCSWHLFSRRQEPIERTWRLRCALIERNGILEYYYCLQLADTSMYILNDIFICIIKEQCSEKRKSTWGWLNSCQNTITDILFQMELLHIVDVPVEQWASTEHQQILVL